MIYRALDGVLWFIFIPNSSGASSLIKFPCDKWPGKSGVSVARERRAHDPIGSVSDFQSGRRMQSVIEVTRDLYTRRQSSSCFFCCIMTVEFQLEVIYFETMRMTSSYLEMEESQEQLTIIINSFWSENKDQNNSANYFPLIKIHSYSSAEQRVERFRNGPLKGLVSDRCYGNLERLELHAAQVIRMPAECRQQTV